MYSGSKNLVDRIEGSELDAGKLVLSPTRTYAPIIKKILSTVDKNQLHGMVHCSGGAQTKILHFVDQLHIIKDNLFQLPPFKIIIEPDLMLHFVRDISSLSWKSSKNLRNN